MNYRIKRVSLQSEVISYIEHYIANNHLTSGDSLPSQGELSSLLGVSRSTLREAVKTLEARGILRVENGKGLFVGDQKDRAQVAASLLGMNQEREQLLEALEVRRALEMQILEMVIQRATNEELDSLGTITENLMDKYYKKEKTTDVDWKFHTKIYSLCHNQVMSSITELLKIHVEHFWEFPLHMKDPFQESMPYHKELYDAIRERDVVKAQKINNCLLDCVYKDIVQK